jgi:hypothetical protein
MTKWYLWARGENQECYYWTHAKWDETDFKVKTVNKLNGKTKIYRADSHEAWVKLMDTIEEPGYRTKDDIIFSLTDHFNSLMSLMKR